MNFRNTFFFYGLLLAMLWGFGLMLAYKRTAVDEAYIVPSLNLPDVKIDSLQIEHHDAKSEAQDALFEKDGDQWYLKKEGQKVKVEGFRIDSMVRQIKEAKKNDEADVNRDLEFYGLASPRSVITLKGKIGKQERELVFKIGKESPDKVFIYANSSDRPKRSFAVTKSTVDSLFFKDPNFLRSKRLFETLETQIDLLSMTHLLNDLVLRKADDKNWKFEKPNLGFADFERPGALPSEKEPVTGVKSLLASVFGLAVDSEADFVPLGEKMATYGLEAGKESLRIELTRTAGKDKEAPKETLLVGRQVAGKDVYYARLTGDDGVFKLAGAKLRPIFDAIAKPGAIRSLDVAAFDPKQVDWITVKGPEGETTFYKEDTKVWKVHAAGDKLRSADEKSINDLLEALQGKRAIVKFHDGDSGDPKFDGDRGFDKSAREIAIYVEGIEKPKKDEKSPAPSSPPTLKKDAKAAVTLTVGKTNQETVEVRRVLQDGLTSRFEATKKFGEPLKFADGPLPYLDLSLPSLDTSEVTKIYLNRAGEKMNLDRVTPFSWQIEDVTEKTGSKPAETVKVNQILGNWAGLKAKRWVKKVANDEDWSKYGLKTPQVVLTLHRRRTDVPTEGKAAVFGQLAVNHPWAAVATHLAHLEQPEKTSLWIGGSPTDDPNGNYIWHSGADFLAVVPSEFLRFLTQTDFRDQSYARNTHPGLLALLLGSVETSIPACLPILSPLSSAQIQNFDPSKVTELKLAIRTREELRHLHFVKKDKQWQDKSGLLEFHLDESKVASLVDQLARLHGDRFALLSGGPKGDHKLDAKDSLIRIEQTIQGSPSITLSIGARFESFGHFAHSTQSPDSVVLVNALFVEPLLRGPSYFGKERSVATGP